MRVFISCIILFVHSLAFSQNVMTLKTKRILDGHGGIIEDKNIIITDGVITEIGKKEAGVVHDLTNLTIMPGGIETHGHLSWHFDPDNKLHDATEAEESTAQSALYAAENAYLTLMGGVTTSQNLGSPIDRELRDAIERGILPGPRILTSLGAIGQWTGDPDSIKAAVNKFADQGADVIKIFASASIRVGGTPTLSQEQLNVACSEAKKRGLRTVVHAHGPESARRAVLAGCTTIEHGALLDKVTLELMAEHGTYYDPNIGLIFDNYFAHKQNYIGINGYTEDGFDQMKQAVPKAIEVFKMALKVKNLKIVFGTDAVAGAHGSNFEELITRVIKGGQQPIDAIVSAGFGSAQSLNLSDKIGTIAVGMQADIIALDGNPLVDITALRNVKFVMKSGKIYKSLE
ncbi:MAG: amidohydrolase family protein [Cyclobacteriaceae bacterium]|nr:amidohydrolase family protein [Cyclobacteriaceae bacterium]